MNLDLYSWQFFSKYNDRIRIHDRGAYIRLATVKPLLITRTDVDQQSKNLTKQTLTSFNILLEFTNGICNVILLILPVETN